MRRSKIIFETTDPLGRTIILDDYGWNHVTTEHPDITNIKKVRSTVHDPDFIMENTTRSANYYVKITDLALYFNVVARIDDDSRKGYIASAYTSREILKGGVIWQKRSKA